MPRFGLFGSLWCLAIVLSPIAEAAHLAEVSAGAYQTECGSGPECGNSDSQSGQTTASASYSNPNGGGGSAFATVGGTFNGGLVLKAFATATGGSGEEGKFVTNSAQASASWSDDVHFTGTFLELLVDFKFEFTGSTSGDALMSVDGLGCIGSKCADPVSFNGPGTIHVNPPFFIPSEVPVTVSLSVGAAATGHGSAFGLPTTSTADASHTLTLLSITPRDTNGNFVPGVTITSDSGFDYNPFIVPEPASASLAVLVVVGLTLARRRMGVASPSSYQSSLPNAT